MITKILEKYSPHSLFARFLLIIAIPVIISQSFATYMFYHRHWQHVTKHMTRSFASEIAVITEVFTNNADHNHEFIKNIKQNLYLYSELHKGNKFIKKSDVTRNSLKTLESEISYRINHPFNVLYVDSRSFIKIEIGIPDGVLEITASRKRIANVTTEIFIAWMVGSNLLLLALTILFMRNQIRPIARLSSAAEKFGRGESLKGFKPEGAIEVRRAAWAFLKMRARIERHVTQRTEMLAGVSHDIRTPLTRIKLQLAMVDKTEEIEEIEEDLKEIEEMIRAYLTFAKDQTSNEESNFTDFSTLIRKLLNSYQKQGHRVTDKIQPNIKMHLKPLAMKRAISNVIDNSLRFASIAEVKVFKKNNDIFIEIDDNGPGIDEKQFEDVFRPFFRVDQSRNQDTGGVGLGLSITRDVINNHGGKITLSRSNFGGLKTQIILPV